jgi:hypothetical protein
MKFDLSSNAGEFFPFFGSKINTDGTIEYLDPEKDAGKVCIRIVDAETLEKIQAQTRTKKSQFVLNTESRKMEKVDYYEQTPEQIKKERQMIFDSAVISWEENKFFDEDGQEIVCNPENKIKMMNDPQFARFVGECFRRITGAKAEAEKVKEKNS